MAVSLEVWCFIYFNYFSNHKHKACETIYLWFSISPTLFDIRMTHKKLLKMAILTL